MGPALRKLWTFVFLEGWRVEGALKCRVWTAECGMRFRNIAGVQRVEALWWVQGGAQKKMNSGEC